MTRQQATKDYITALVLIVTAVTINKQAQILAIVLVMVAIVLLAQILRRLI